MDYPASRVMVQDGWHIKLQTRCAMALGEWDIGISVMAIWQLLEDLGCREVKLNFHQLLAEAKQKASYQRGADLSQAPEVVDCSSLVQWVYAQLGVALPRYAIEQRKFGTLVGLGQLLPGDLVFKSGLIDRYDHDSEDGVGHVGIVSGFNLVVHAKNGGEGVTEEPLENFIRDPQSFRGTYRIFTSAEVYTVSVPEFLTVHYSSDLKWKVASKLKR